MSDKAWKAFEVPGVPVAMQRNRSARLMGGGTVNYQPEKTRNFKSDVKQFASAVMGNEPPTDETCAIDMLFVFQAPKSLKARDRKLIESGELLVYDRINKDLDNLMKSVCDGLQGVVVRDDKQFVDATISKRIGNRPRTEVRIYTNPFKKE